MAKKLKVLQHIEQGAPREAGGAIKLFETSHASQYLPITEIEGGIQIPVDGRMRTVPTKILDRWKGLGLVEVVEG